MIGDAKGHINRFEFDGEHVLTVAVADEELTVCVPFERLVLHLLRALFRQRRLAHSEGLGEWLRYVGLDVARIQIEGR